MQHTTEMFQYMNELRQDYGSLSRFYHIQNSPERRIRFTDFWNSNLEKLEKLPFSQFSLGGKVDYVLTKRYIENELHKLEIEEKEYSKLQSWVEYGNVIYELEKERRRGKHLDGKASAMKLNETKVIVENLSSKLENSDMFFSKSLIDRAKGVIAGHKKAVKSVYEFYEGYDPQFTWWITKPYEDLSGALEGYSEMFEARVDTSTLQADDGSGIIGNPIGREAIVQQLKYQMISYTPEELIEIATKEFAWCDAELLKATEEMGFGENWKKAQEKVKESYVPEGYQPEEMLKLYDESVSFLKKNDLLTIPPIAEETWRMSMISPERQLVSPFFLGGEVLQIAYPTDEMSHENKLMSFRSNNPHFARAVVHHELIAGHHLQFFMNRRNKTYRFYNSPFWMEGWALYWEMLLWDMDFARSPEDKVGMLFWRMHRCARIIFSLKYHLGEWTPQQCIDYLVDRVGHERANAEGEVRRSFTGNYGPLYQLAYMTGGLQFYELKKEVVDNGNMTIKEFHDAVLKENSLPVEMLRAILLNQQIDKDFESSWRFYKN